MRTGCLLKILLLLVVIVGAWEYWSWFERMKARVAEIRTLSAQISGTLSDRQKTWGAIEAATVDVAALRKREEAATEQQDKLRAQERRLTGEIKYLVLSMKEAVATVRKAAVNTSVDELKLDGGENLKNARILKVTDDSITFLHEDGVANIRIETDKLPPEWLQRYDLGGVSIANRLRVLEERLTGK